jgi:hypothetical protein
MLSTPQGAGTVGHNSILYFTATDIVSTHAAIVERGAKNERAPQLTAKMPDHELWAGFVRDPDGNLIGPYGGEALMRDSTMPLHQALQQAWVVGLCKTPNYEMDPL